MKLRNKKTGKIYDLTYLPQIDCVVEMLLDGVMEKYEEPKKVYFIDTQNGVVDYFELYNDYIADVDFNSKIGNYFETKEEAERAVEKLKAWKRLRDNGVGFSDQLYALDLNGGICLRVYRNGYRNLDEDIDIIFGDEE